MISRRSVAFHEAGHAAVALHLGWMVTELHVLGGVDGHTDAHSPTWPASLVEDTLVLLGARAGEERSGHVTTARESNLEAEWSKALDRYRRRCGADAAESQVQQLLERCRDIVEEHSDAFARIAEHLENGPRVMHLDEAQVLALWRGR